MSTILYCIDLGALIIQMISVISVSITQFGTLASGMAKHRLTHVRVNLDWEIFSIYYVY